MSRIDPDVDQVQQRLDERRALLAQAAGANAAQLRADIARLEQQHSDERGQTSGCR